MIEKIVDECAGCDVPVGDLGQYAQNGKCYCPRCYEEVTAMFKRNYEDKKHITKNCMV